MSTIRYIEFCVTYRIQTVLCVVYDTDSLVSTILYKQSCANYRIHALLCVLYDTDIIVSTIGYRQSCVYYGIQTVFCLLLDTDSLVSTLGYRQSCVYYKIQKMSKNIRGRGNYSQKLGNLLQFFLLLSIFQILLFKNLLTKKCLKNFGY